MREKLFEQIFSSQQDTDYHQLSICVDRNDLGEISFDLDFDKGTKYQKGYHVWFDRDVAFDLATNILKQLSLYPYDNAQRLKEGNTCACEDYLQEETTDTQP